MSQKYKNFTSKSCVATDDNSVLPHDVKRVGYLRKLKRMKRRFFVLRMASPAGSARLEYYSSEKKWKSGCEPRRCIELSNCLNIGRKLHSKQRNVLALYTRDDCFSVVTETPEELELWLEDMLEIQRCVVTFNENKGITLFEHLWQVNIEKHDLECNQNLSGPYLIALSSKALTLIKMDPASNFDCLEFPLMSIRRCGHSKDFFFIELGRSAITGAGEIYMSTEGTIVAQNMHETVLGAMKSSKVREDGNLPPRPRSASISENSIPVSTRRPIGVVAPQTLPSATSNTLSNSRERCDSLPTRPKTLNENSHNLVFSALSSPHSSTGVANKRLSSRPHSMYEWPSFSSPSTRITSPFSLSSNGGFACSSEDVDSLKQSSSFYSQSKSSDGTLSDRPLAEVPDEYLSMSPSDESRTEMTGYMFMAQSETSSLTSTDTLNYMDMKSSKSDVSICLTKKPDNYIHMAHGGARENVPLAMQDGYLDMSPSSKSYLKNFNDISSLERNRSKPSVRADLKEEFHLEKVSSLLKADENEKKSEPQKDRSSHDSIEMAINHPLVLRSLNHSKCKNDDIPVIQTPTKENENFVVKPPIPERTYKCDKMYSGPPLPVRRYDHQSNSVAKIFYKTENFNCKLKHAQTEFKHVIPRDSSECTQAEENSVFHEPEECAIHKRNLNKASPSDQNTNFSCLSNSENFFNITLPCASTCCAQQPVDSFPVGQNENPTTKDADMSAHSENCSQTQNALSVNHLSKSCNQNVILPVKDAGPSCGDYVNLEFKNTNSNPTPSNSIGSKNIQLLPALQTDANYSNINFGKPFCPTTNPSPAMCDGTVFGGSLKSEKRYKFSDQHTVSLNNNNNSVQEPTSNSKPISDRAGELVNTTPSKIRNIPNLFPAFRKQMSAPVAPVSLRPELASPGRKSSCPVTASASMVKPATTVTPVRPVLLLLQGATPGHLRVSTSRSPDHSSVSSISSASDEINSNHSSPKVLSASQSLCVVPKTSNASDSFYENVVIAPQRPATSRPSSVSSEKELNYALLDLAPSVRDDVSRLPAVQKPVCTENSEALQYAEIDFTKSEGLKNTSGTLREGRS